MKNNKPIDDLNKKEIDDYMKFSVPYSDENNENIKAKFYKNATKTNIKTSRKKVIGLVAIASTLLFSTLIYAGVLDFSEIYHKVFGENSAYLNNKITPLDGQGSQNQTVGAETHDSNNSKVQDEDNGILLRLVSALKDEKQLYVFFTITDTIGNRISENSSIERWWLSQGNGGSCQIVDYNNATKTATFLITSHSEDGFDDNISLNVEDVLTETVESKDVVENINFYELLHNYTPTIIDQNKDVYKLGGSYNFEDKLSENLYETSKLLAIDENEIKFDSADWTRITNFGFVDGAFHVQWVKPSFLDSSNLNNLTITTENFSENPSLSVMFVKNEDSHGNPKGNIYTEFIYPNITNIEQLKDAKITIDYFKQGETIRGSWEVNFKAPPQMEKIEFSVNEEIELTGGTIFVETAYLSLLGISINLENNENKHLIGEEDSAYVLYADGTKVELKSASTITTNNNTLLTFSGNIVEIEKVSRIVVNGKSINKFRA